MRIENPQDAILTNIEVLAHLTINPPRRPPNPPPNSRHWVPSPDLRDHNTVVKEIHNYALRLSPHILQYPKFTSSAPKKKGKETRTGTEPTPLDNALRELVTRLQPYGLTKGEVLMLVNLGVGLPSSSPSGGEGEGESMDVDGLGDEHGAADGTGENGEGVADPGAEGAGEGEEGGEEGEAGDYGALALVDTVIEEREQRLSEENVTDILSIVRETLGARLVPH